MSRFEGRLVLITGASSGFGEACARGFAAEGADLVLWARRLSRLQKLRDELTRTHGAKVRTEELDVRDREAVLALGRELTDAGTIPDILVNNAGLAAGLIDDRLREDSRRVLAAFLALVEEGVKS